LRKSGPCKRLHHILLSQQSRCSFERWVCHHKLHHLPGPRIPLKTRIGHPSSENRAYNREHEYANISTDFLKSKAQKGWEYSRWIDLRLGIHFEAVILERCRTKVRFISKSTCLGQKRCPRKVQKGPAAPMPFFGSKQKRSAST